MFYLLNILIQMKILLNNQSLDKSLRPFNDVGFVPTMGGIHNGHISLINRSKKLCKKTVVSIFINPKQFNNKNDFKNYPYNIKKDISILKKIKAVDFLYIPKFKDIFNSKKNLKIKIKKKDKILCAKFRKGHFEGVLEVMDSFTNLIKPNKIFMGKKDFQQLFLVKNFIENKYKTKVVACKTIRDKNMIALSSRNYLLDKNALNIVSKTTKKLFLIKKTIKNINNINNFLLKEKKQIQKKFNIKIEYMELRNEKNLLFSNKSIRSRLFLSYYINGIRLIDNF
ncbi:MAG: pantoate--beta-alanine ligase [Candidatus Pelagibacter sp.]